MPIPAQSTAAYYSLCLFVCRSIRLSVYSSVSLSVRLSCLLWVFVPRTNQVYIKFCQSSNRFSLAYKHESYSRNYVYVYVYKKTFYIVECKLRVQRIPQSSAFGSSLLVVFIGVNYLHFCTSILLALVVGIGICIAYVLCAAAFTVCSCFCFSLHLLFLQAHFNCNCYALLYLCLYLYAISFSSVCPSLCPFVRPSVRLTA